MFETMAMDFRAARVHFVATHWLGRILLQLLTVLSRKHKYVFQTPSRSPT